MAGTNLGYATLAITTSVAGINEQLRSAITGPVQQAANQASKTLSDTMKSGAERAAEEVKRAYEKEAKAADAVVAADRKIADAKEMVLIKTRAVQAAEADLERVRSSSSSKIAQAEQRLNDLRNSSKASADQIADAERRLNEARLSGESAILRRQNAVDKAKAAEMSATEAVAAATEKRKAAASGLADAQDNITAATERYNRISAEGTKQTHGFADAISSMKSKIGGSVQAIGSLAQQAVLPATAALGALTLAAKDAMSWAAEAEQSYGAVESIFSEHADQITAASKQAANAVGLSGREYRELSAQTGAMLKNMGFPMQEVADRSQNLVSVGADLAATFGGTTKEAIEAIGALMRGETDPIERYGVSIRQSDINARLAAKGLDKLEGAALKQASAQELLAMLSEQTASAQGQFARETDTAAHKQQVATAKINDAKEAIGTGLLPVMATLADWGAKVASVIGEHPRIFIAVAGAIGTLSAAIIGISGAASIFTALSGAAAAAGTTIGGLVATTAAAIAPIAGIVAAVVAAGAALWAFFTKTETGRQMWQSLVDSFVWAKDKLAEVFSNIKIGFGELVDAFNGGDSGYGALAALVGDQWANAWVNASARLGEVWGNIKLGFGELVSAFNGEDAGYGALASLIGDQWANAWADTAARMGEAWTNIKQGFWELVDAFNGDDSGNGALASVIGTEWADRIWDGANRAGEAFRYVRDRFSEVIQGFNDGGLTGAIQAAFGEETSNWIMGWVETVRGSLGFLGDFVRDHLGGAFSSLKDAFYSIIDSFSAVGGALYDALLPALQSFWNLLQQLWQVLEPVLMPVLNTLGYVLGGVIVGAVMLVVTNLEAMANGIRIAADIINWLVQNALVPWIGQMGEAARILLDVLGFAVRAVGDYFRAVWDTQFKPVIDLLVGAIMWLVNNVAVPMFNLLKDTWNNAGIVMRAVYDNVINTMFQVFIALVNWFLNNVWIPVMNGIQNSWNFMAGFAKGVYDGVINPMFQAFNGLINWFLNSVWNPILQTMQNAWSFMANLIKSVVDTVITGTFNTFQGALTTLKNWFQSTVDNIGTIWDGIREKTKKPVEFVVNTVYNGGIRKAWNAVAKLVGLGELPEHHFARGGVLPGYAPGQDTMHFYSPVWGSLHMSPGEGILVPEAVQGMGGPKAIEALNKTARTKGVSGVRRNLGEGAAFSRGGIFGLPEMRFAGGGNVDLDGKIAALFDQLKGEHGKPYQYGGVGNPSWDCSGIWSGIVQFLNGGSLRGGRIFNTESVFENFGFEKGLNGRVTIGVMRGGGGPNSHMAGTIDGVNIESAGDHGVQIGGAARGSDNSLFTLHWTLKDFLGEFVSGGNGGGGFSIAGMAKRLWDAAIGKIGEFPGKEQFGDFGKLPAAMLKTMADKAWEFLKSKLGTFSGAGGVAGNAESWREMAMAAMRRQGFNADDPRQVDAMLKQIMSESGGNPGIAQQIHDVNGTGESAGVGLLQIIPGTFAANRDPELPDDRRDPWANMNAALRYYKSRYGTDLTTMWGHGHGYDAGGWLKPTPGGFGTYFNHTGKPEAVLTADQWKRIQDLIEGLREAQPALTELAHPNSTVKVDISDRLARTVATGDFPGAVPGYLEESNPLVGMAVDAARTLDSLEGEWGNLRGLPEELGRIYAAGPEGWDRVSRALLHTATTGDIIATGLVDEDSPLNVAALKTHDAIVEGQRQVREAVVNTARQYGIDIPAIEKAIADGVENNRKWASGELDNKGRLGTPEEIAQDFGGILAEEYGNQLAGLVGLKGIVKVPRLLDDELRHKREERAAAHPENDPAPSPNAEPQPGPVPTPEPTPSVADQAPVHVQNGGDTITVNVTLSTNDADDPAKLARVVDQLKAEFDRLKHDRRPANTQTRGGNI